MKLACALAIMDALPKFNPNRGKIDGFLKYPMQHAVKEELRVMRSGFPISTKSTDPLLRKIMWLYHENNDQHDPEALAEIGRQVNREPKTVLKYILDGTTNEIISRKTKRTRRRRRKRRMTTTMIIYSSRFAEIPNGSRRTASFSRSSPG